MFLLQSPLVILITCFFSFGSAVPVVETDLQPSRTKHERQVDLGAIVGAVVTPILNGLAADATDGAAIVSALIQAAEDTLGNQIPSAPTDIPDAVATLSSIFAATPTDLITNILELVPSGFVLDDLENLLSASIDPRNSVANNNPPPLDVIYPKKDTRDAPYSLSETELRQVIYIPPTFTFGQKPPVVLVPGTGNTGFQTFIGNYIPLLTNVDYADPVWLNIPGQLLGDAQIHAEYVAYAVNYISSITGNHNNVNVLTWSQGSIDAQWAFKYWPSTRNVTQNLIANSPDYHGTVLANLICPDFPRLPCDPAVLQQEYNSNFITTLRSNGGDAGIVPTTNIYSSTDEIVQPQSPLTGASAYLLDTCSVGVTNVLIQETCGGRGVGGTFYTHEGVLYSSLGVALALDALQNGRPARLADLDLDTVCASYLGRGLDLINLLTTEEAILIAGLSLILYQPKVFVEPAIKAYATGPVVPAGACAIQSPSASASSSSSFASATQSRPTSSVSFRSETTSSSSPPVSGQSSTPSTLTTATTSYSSTSTKTSNGPEIFSSPASSRQTPGTTASTQTTTSSTFRHHGHQTRSSTTVNNSLATSASSSENDDEHNHPHPQSSPTRSRAAANYDGYAATSTSRPVHEADYSGVGQPTHDYGGSDAKSGHCHKKKRRM